jgi:hypothetical protein
MSESARTRRALVGVAIGTGLAVVMGFAALQMGKAADAWTLWLQNFVNLMKVLELGTFTFSAYQFWAGRRERIAADKVAAVRGVIDSNYQAWQVINSAQGKGGSGGRIDALADLLRNGVSLAGIRLDDAWLEGVQLPNAMLHGGSFQRTTLKQANFAGANLEGADFTDADLVAADLTGAYLKGANLTRARLSAARLDHVDLTDVIGWREIKSISYASIARVRHTPTGFLEFAKEQGALDGLPSASVDAENDTDTNAFSREFRSV